MKKLAFALVICLLASMLPTAALSDEVAIPEEEALFAANVSGMTISQDMGCGN